MHTYVMSDIHGCYDEFQKMLKKIQFTDDDLLICAGDYIDRGTKNYEMMSWIANAPANVILVRGNHEEDYLSNIRMMQLVCGKSRFDQYNIEDTRTLYKTVQELAKQEKDIAFDGCGTIGKLINEELVSFAVLCAWAEKIEKMPYYYKTEINKRTCIVVHAGYIESLDHGMIIAGHTPTIKYEEFPYNNGDVFRMYDEKLDCIFYDIDCGCVMANTQENAKLACIRLDDEKIYYVKKSDKTQSKELNLDGMMGLVTGDALGVPVEFSKRENMKERPVTEMLGYGAHPVPAGSWSDDSSMALASLFALHTDGINLKKTMDCFVDWEENGEFTPAGEVFDEGNTCSFAIYHYKQCQDITACGQSWDKCNGNGSLMRILPVCIYLKYLQDECGLNDRTCIEMVHHISALTHAHLRSKMACGIYFCCVRELAKRKQSLAERLQQAMDLAFAFYEQNSESREELKYFTRIRNIEKLRTIPESQINSGGYVIDSIEAALWCLITTASYASCVLKAVNLGDDTDTTAAIAGGLAGIYYGYKNIPERWLKVIIRRDWIEDLCKTID